VYFNVSKNFYITSRDAQAVLDFVYKGNTAFISAANIDTVLLSKIYCKQSKYISPAMLMAMPFRKTAVNFAEAVTPGVPAYDYFYYPFTASFPQINGTYARIVGYNDSKEVNAIIFFWGKGRLIPAHRAEGFQQLFFAEQG
jgi:hypothetical protein